MTENINLEYKVEFKDGLKPRLHVYGIDSETKEIYGVEARVGVLVGAGYHLNIPSKEDVLVDVYMATRLDISLIVNKFRIKLPESENWEQEIHEGWRNHGTNVIRVQNPDHIQPAIDRHAQLYGEQFRELAERFANLYIGFIGEHPGYDFKE